MRGVRAPLGECVNEKKCRLIVAERSEGFCERCCRSDRRLTMHHRKKRGQGGLWTPENIVALCGHGTVGCHGWVEHFPDAAAVRGWHVRPWQNPAEAPVLWRGSDWVLLTAEGKTQRVDCNS